LVSVSTEHVSRAPRQTAETHRSETLDLSNKNRYFRLVPYFGDCMVSTHKPHMIKVAKRMGATAIWFFDPSFCYFTTTSSENVNKITKAMAVLKYQLPTRVMVNWNAAKGIMRLKVYWKASLSHLSTTELFCWRERERCEY